MEGDLKNLVLFNREEKGEKETEEKKAKDLLELLRDYKKLYLENYEKSKYHIRELYKVVKMSRELDKSEKNDISESRLNDLNIIKLQASVIFESFKMRQKIFKDNFITFIENKLIRKIEIALKVHSDNFLKENHEYSTLILNETIDEVKTIYERLTKMANQSYFSSCFKCYEAMDIIMKGKDIMNTSYDIENDPFAQTLFTFEKFKRDLIKQSEFFLCFGFGFLVKKDEISKLESKVINEYKKSLQWKKMEKISGTATMAKIFDVDICTSYVFDKSGRLSMEKEIENSYLNFEPSFNSYSDIPLSNFL